MILGHIQNLAQDKAALAPVLQQGLEYLKTTDFLTMAPGRYDLDGDNFYALVQVNKPVPKRERRAEVHAQYVDIQYVVEGAEIIGYCDVAHGGAVSENLLAKQDVMFYKTVEHESELILTAGMYAIFFPWDIHRPSCYLPPYDTVKKVVLKIKASKLGLKTEPNMVGGQ